MAGGGGMDVGFVGVEGVVRRWSLAEALEKVDALGMDAVWRLLVLGNGSPTMNLQLLSGIRTQVEVLGMGRVEDAVVGREVEEVGLLEGPLVLRRVFLHSRPKYSDVWIYAESWWNEAVCGAHLEDKKMPIWKSLATKKTEVYREILQIYSIHSTALERVFGCKGPFWARHYLFWKGGVPLTLIREVFNPKLGNVESGKSPKMGKEDGGGGGEGGGGKEGKRGGVREEGVVGGGGTGE